MLEQRHTDFLDLLFETAANTTPHNKRGEFTEWCADFCSDNAERYAQYGDGTRFTSKQWNVLFDIGKKLGIPDPRGIGSYEKVVDIKGKPVDYSDV